MLLHPFYALKDNGISTEYNHVLARTALLDFLQSIGTDPDIYFKKAGNMVEEFYQLACKLAGKTYFLDKTPRYYFILSELAEAFSDARFLILVRNPLGVLNSVLNTRVEGNWLLLNRYYDDLVTAPQRLVEGKKLFGNNLFWLRYEDLVTHPKEVLRRICDYIGIEFVPDMIFYGDQPQLSGRMGDEKTIEELNKPSPVRMDQWKALGEHNQTRHFGIEYLNALGDPLIEELGYNPEELRSELDKSTGLSRSVEIQWNEVMHPDQDLKRRLVYIEMALLWNRKIVHWIKKNILRK